MDWIEIYGSRDDICGFMYKQLLYAKTAQDYVGLHNIVV